ncbi:MAG: AAA family ATPase [Rhodocyclaceae bacterium]|nr:AAA family ATPase [Rhodocyclaceae bacterium]MBX3668741.1 AAA family ATPase [Rhodocyclaceae bacterium]
MSGAAIHIPLAGFREIYRVGDVDRAMEESAPARNEALTAFYEKMRKLGGVRYIVKPSSYDGIDPLYDSCPNFSEVIDDLKKYLALAVAGDEAMNFTPILLLGEPGIGKTHFAKELAAALGTGYEFVSMSSLTAGWILSGASAQWNHSKPGKVAQTLVNGEYANPVMVLDEVDKAGGDSRYDPMGALYGLLERETARHFKDEFVEIDMDASHVMWVSTANDERSIPEPILNRMNVYTVRRPNRDEAAAIARSLYAEIVREHDWGFPPEASDEVVDALAALPPRDMRKVLLAAFGNAKLDRRDRLLVKDLEAGRATRGKAKIGF